MPTEEKNMIEVYGTPCCSILEGMHMIKSMLTHEKLTDVLDT